MDPAGLARRAAAPAAGAALLLALAACAATGQPTRCADGAPDGYDGPCYYGALPAYFDDFGYTSAALPAAAPNSGSIFGMNAWALRDGIAQTRGWYRYNRHDLPTSGTIAFEAPSILDLRLPEGLAAGDHVRDLVLLSGAPMTAGTYHWRVRLSPHWTGQAMRQSIWLFSATEYAFDRLTATDSTRHLYWSELDFENENHFQGEQIEGRLQLDYVTRMSVTNHVGRVEDARGSRRLSHAGEVAWHEGHGVLARNGPGRPPVGEAAPLSAWADRWLHLILVVDDAARTVTYRMLPAEPRPGDPMGAVAARSLTMGETFYPVAPLAGAFSVRWPDAEGRLAHTLGLEADWFYHTPVVGLSDTEVVRQVAVLRERGLPRANTTGRPTFVPWGEPDRLTAVIEGPDRVACGEAARWRLSAEPGGTRYLATLRYRLLGASGTPGAWQPVYAPTLTLTPRTGQGGVELEGTLQDFWEPAAPVALPNGWPLPAPGNYAATAHRTVRFDCGG
jgi:hypothetical protein